MSEKQIKITLKRSVIKAKPAQLKTIKALGLNKINSTAVHKVTAPILGMINCVSHLVEVEDIQ